MKLSPPGSSSDLETARAIARRLSQSAPGRGTSGRLPLSPPPGPPLAPGPQGGPATTPPMKPARPSRPEPPPVPEPPAPPPPRTERTPTLIRSEPLVPPPVFELEAESDRAEPPRLEPDLEVPPLPTPTARENEPELELVADLESAMAEEPPPPPAAPSWTDILQDCLFLARAQGGLLIDTHGEVVASCGDWPQPGVDAIAVRLVPAMDKALKDAPTRSVSVPLGGKHLTAWRVPVEGGMLTVGFVAEAPLKPEVRPSIDAELKSGQV